MPAARPCPRTLHGDARPPVPCPETGGGGHVGDHPGAPARRLLHGRAPDPVRAATGRCGRVVDGRCQRRRRPQQLEQVGQATFTADYDVLRKLGQATTKATVVQQGTQRRSVTVGDVRFLQAVDQPNRDVRPRRPDLRGQHRSRPASATLSVTPTSSPPRPPGGCASPRPAVGPDDGVDPHDRRPAGDVRRGARRRRQRDVLRPRRRRRGAVGRRRPARRAHELQPEGRRAPVRDHAVAPHGHAARARMRATT